MKKLMLMLMAVSLLSLTSSSVARASSSLERQNAATRSTAAQSSITQTERLPSVAQAPELSPDATQWWVIEQVLKAILEHLQTRQR